MFVEFITATWCGRCKEIKPRVMQICATMSTMLTFVDYEEMDEEAKAAITSLPTIRMRTTATEPWVTYVAATIEDWVDAMASQKLVMSDTDF